jgi:hypothetical protein
MPRAMRSSIVLKPRAASAGTRNRLPYFFRIASRLYGPGPVAEK